MKHEPWTEICSRHEGGRVTMRWEKKVINPSSVHQVWFAQNSKIYFFHFIKHISLFSVFVVVEEFGLQLSIK